MAAPGARRTFLDPRVHVAWVAPLLVMVAWGLISSYFTQKSLVSASLSQTHAINGLTNAVKSINEEQARARQDREDARRDRDRMEREIEAVRMSPFQHRGNEGGQ